MKKRYKHPRHISIERIIIASVVTVITAISVMGFSMLSLDDVDMYTAAYDFLHYIRIVFLQPRLSSSMSWTELIQALCTTLSLAFLTTVTGTFCAFFLAIAASQNLALQLFSCIVSAVMSVIRAIPTIIWVLVFSVTVNIGIDAAVLGMTLHSIAYLVKGFSESFEHINKDTIDALRACGADLPAIISQAVLPSAAPALIAWTFFRFEINVINAVIIGTAAGAGGIGYHLFIAGSLNFDMHETGFFTYTIFLIALTLEFGSTRIRRKFQ